MRAAGLRAMRRYHRLIIAACLVGGCTTQRVLSLEDYGWLERWLTCDECVNGEREIARRMGDRAVGKLDAALVAPSPQRTALMRGKLRDSYRFANKPGADSDAYINPRLENYIATYQKRAAISLGDIGTKPARDAIDRAIRDSAARDYRPDVMRTIRIVRTGVGTPRFGGRITPRHLSYGEIITVTAPPGRHFTAQDSAWIADSPFPRDQIPLGYLGDTLRFFAVGDAGQHVIVVTNPLKGATAVDSVTITSLMDASDRAVRGCPPANTVCAVDSALPLQSPMARAPGRPFAIFLALSRLPPRPDTVDFLRVKPPTNLPLTAVLDWHGPANLDLGWRKCSPFVPAPFPASAVGSFASAESTSVVIPAGECWILQVSMGPGGNGPAFARLRVRSP